jgi:hypothetical protein
MVDRLWKKICQRAYMRGYAAGWDAAIAIAMERAKECDRNLKMQARHYRNYMEED